MCICIHLQPPSESFHVNMASPSLPRSLPMQGGFAAIDSALSEVDRKDVRGIGISGQQHGFVPMDGDGQVSFSGMPLFTCLAMPSGCCNFACHQIRLYIWGMQRLTDARILTHFDIAQLWCRVESAWKAEHLSD